VVDRNQPLFLNARPPRAEVAVVYNPLAHFVGGRQRAAAYGGPQGEVAGIERDSLLGVHRALFPSNAPLDYVHIDHITAASLVGYKLVILPYPPMLPERSAAVFKEYVAAGGALVAEARLGWNNERGIASASIPGLGLAEVMGCRETDVQTGPKGRTAIRWSSEALPGLKPGAMLPARWYEETLETLGAGARIAGTFEDGRPAAIFSTFKKGKTLMLGSYVSAAYQSSPSPEARAFYNALLEWAAVGRPVSISGAPVEVKSVNSGRDRILYVFNHGDAPSTSLVGVKGSWRAVDLVTDRLFPAKTAGGVTQFDVRLAPRAVQVLHLTNTTAGAFARGRPTRPTTRDRIGPDSPAPAQGCKNWL
jgi:beta-galactosidase